MPKNAGKDAGKPKRAMSAYMIFSIEKRPQVVAANPDIAFGDVAKEISRQWHELSDADKGPYEAKAEADKARYATEMETYEPPEGGAGGGKKKKAKKDKDAPKRPLQAFLCFCQKVRSEVKAANPDLATTEITKVMATQWKALDAAGREPYTRAAEEDKARYEREMAAYKEAGN